MAVENYQLEIYQKIWSLILNDSDFRTISGITVGANNQIRVDNGKVAPVKRTIGQDGDLPELAFNIGEIRDNGNDGQQDENRPTFAVVEGGEVDDPTVIDYDYTGTLTYPSERFEKFFPLIEVIRRNIRGYALRKAGLLYAGNTSLLIEYNPTADWGKVKRPQHQITVTVEVMKN